MHEDELDALEAMTKHRRLAEQFAHEADAIVNDKKLFAEMGWGVVNAYVNLANLHLTLRQVYREAR